MARMSAATKYFLHCFEKAPGCVLPRFEHRFYSTNILSHSHGQIIKGCRFFYIDTTKREGLIIVIPVHSNIFVRYRLNVSSIMQRSCCNSLLHGFLLKKNGWYKVRSSANESIVFSVMHKRSLMDTRKRKQKNRVRNKLKNIRSGLFRLKRIRRKYNRVS